MSNNTQQSPFLSFKIGTFNVNSINIRQNHLLEILTQEEPDILLLQELKCTEDCLPSSLTQHSEYQIIYNCQKAFNGCAILIHKSFPIQILTVKQYFDQELAHQARYLELQVKIKDHNFIIASIYVPNGGEINSDKFQFKIQFLQKLQIHLENLRAQQFNLIIGGDYNIAAYEQDLSNPLNWQESICFSPIERKLIRNLFNTGMYDAFRILHGNNIEYSWFDYRQGALQKNHGMRIDYILLSDQTIKFLQKAYFCPKWRHQERPSDHIPFFTELLI